MANWSKQFTQIDNVNNGREIQITDTPTTEIFNVGLNNTQYLYDLLNAGFIDSIQVTNNSIVVSKKNASGVPTSLTISISDLNGYTKNQIDTALNSINQRLNELGFKYPAATQYFTLAVGGRSILNISVSAGASGDRSRTSREGNRTLLKFGVNVLGGNDSYFRNFYTNGNTATSSQALPELYRPKEEQVFYVYTRVEYRYTSSVTSQTYVSMIPLPIKITLGTDGVFSAQVPMNPSFPSYTPLSYYQTYSSSFLSMSIGYTNNPIN